MMKKFVLAAVLPLTLAMSMSGSVQARELKSVGITVG